MIRADTPAGSPSDAAADDVRAALTSGAGPDAQQRAAARSGQGEGADAGRLQPLAAGLPPHISLDDCRDQKTRGDGSGKYHGWVRDHYSYCQWRTITYSVYDASKAVYFGSVKFRSTLVGWGSRSNDPATGRLVGLRLAVDNFSTPYMDGDAGKGKIPEFNLGIVLGSQLEVGMECLGDPKPATSCAQRSGSYQAAPVAAWTALSRAGRTTYSYSFGSDPSAGDQKTREKLATAVFAGIFQPYTPENPPTTSRIQACVSGHEEVACTAPDLVRFDSARYLWTPRIQEQGLVFNQGTVFPRVMPFLRYHTSPSYGMPQAAQHILDAFTQPANTDPKWPGKTIPGKWPGKDFVPGTPGEFLHRMTGNAKAVRQNRYYARKTCIAVSAPADYVVDPVTGQRSRECDEFPFASTKEGAAARDSAGNLLNRYSARAIDGSQNRLGGNELADWYALDRILDGDEFSIDVVNDVDAGRSTGSPVSANGPATARAEASSPPNARALADPTDAWHGPVKLFTHANEYVLAVAQAGGSGTRTVEWSDLDGDEQWWWFEDGPGGTTILHPAHDTSLCLDDAGSTVNASPLRVATCNNTSAQQFVFARVPQTRQDFTLRPASDQAQCIDALQQNQGDVPQMWSCSGVPQQRWEFAEDD
ncbi:hypothetical protein ADK54_31560 [Streptomyces sp. WM6378]|nr:hypothetical protein ADK54_31560 [Streptomyces sp. WM6378]